MFFESVTSLTSASARDVETSTSRTTGGDFVTLSRCIRIDQELSHDGEKEKQVQKIVITFVLAYLFLCALAGITVVRAFHSRKS